jgi:hypothetical protein
MSSRVRKMAIDDEDDEAEDEEVWEEVSRNLEKWRGKRCSFFRWKIERN